MNKKYFIIPAIIGALTFANQAMASDSLAPSQFKQDYARLVYLNYSDAYRDAQNLRQSIIKFLDNPTESNLNEAKADWLYARKSYGQSEVFRFYEGPIDFAKNDKGEEGPEGRINSWPLDESYIDYTKGKPNSGIVNDPKSIITKEALVEANQKFDESQVSLGYHAIEFLLWGQDLSPDSAGNRSVADYAKDQTKRRQYLSLAAEMLVNDLAFLVKEWQPNSSSKNYVQQFVVYNDKKVQQNILTSLATLSGFELASERMATALDSGDQEDEQSCFSDNTHNDFIYNQQGIKNVYLGSYKDFKGVGIYNIIAQKNQQLADKILNQIEKTSKLIAEIPQPIDREVLASGKGSVGRKKMEQAVKSLQEQAQLFLQAGVLLKVDAKIMR